MEGKLDQGPLIVVSNHPHGMLDSLALYSLLGGVQGNLKIVAAKMFEVVDPEHEFIIPVDMDNSGGNQNVLRLALQHLNKKGILLIFPAGNTAVFNGREIIETPWTSTFVNLALKSKAGVLPVKVEGRNSILYYFLDFFLPRNFSAFLHPGELYKLTPAAVPVKVGEIFDVHKMYDAGYTPQEISSSLRRLVNSL